MPAGTWRSTHQQGCNDSALFARQHIKSAAGSSRVHGLETDALFHDRRDERAGRESLRLAAAEQDDFRLKFKHGGKVPDIHVRNDRRRPFANHRIRAQYDMAGQHLAIDVQFARTVGANNISVVFFQIQLHTGILLDQHSISFGFSILGRIT